MVPVVAIDGPSGSGKGTASKQLARALGFSFLDSGAIYRVVGLAALEAGCSFDDVPGLLRLIDRIEIVFDFDATDDRAILLNGQGVSSAIRSEQVASAASQVAAIPEVRSSLLDLQRGFRRPVPVV